MYNCKKAIILFLFCSLSISKINSQDFSKGQIFSNKGDTAYGYVILPGNSKQSHICSFKPTLRDRPVTLSANEIRGFQAAGETYISTKVRLNDKDTVLFVKEIFNGDTDLRCFEFKNLKFFIIVRPDNSIFTIKSPPDLSSDEVFAGQTAKKKFRQQVDSIFPDAQYLPEYQRGVKPDLKSMLTLFRQYHNIPTRRDLMEVIPGIIAGAGFENFIVDVENNSYKSAADPAPFIGVNLIVRNKTKMAGLLLSNTIAYHTDRYSYKQNIDDVTLYYQTSIKSFADNLRAGFSMMPVKNTDFKPVIEAGGAARYYFGTSYENFTEEVYIDLLSLTSHNHDVLNSSFYYGGFARIGMNKILENGGSVSVFCGYNFLTASGKERIHSAELSVIYNFLKP